MTVLTEWRLQRETGEPQTIVRLTHPGDPASKSRARFTKRGSKTMAYTPEKTRQAELALGWQVRRAVPGLQIDGRQSFGVMACFFTATWQRRDVDNMLKLVMDACTGLVWVDDSQVTEISARLVRADESPRTELWIYQTSLQEAPTRACEQCSTPFRTYRSQVERRYCSRRCAGLARRVHQDRACEQCGSIYRVEDAGQRFCSRECGEAYRRVDLVCAQCGGGYSIPRSLNKAGLTMCSQECRAAYWKVHRRTSPKGTCATCGGPTSKKTYTNCRACQHHGGSLKVKKDAAA